MILRSRYAVPHTYGMMPFVASNIFSRSNLPLFSTFFLWSVGTGGMLLVRPLFAASLGASVFWVSVLIASNGLARMVAAPVSGFLSDRLGRKPVVIMGVSLRAASSILAFFATSYEQFLILEFFGGMGVSVWATASAIIMADMSGEHQRGRAVAVRTMSIRLGTVAGPFIGGVLAMAFGLPAILLFNGVTKLVVLAVIISRFTETHTVEQRERQAAAATAPVSFRIFLSPAYLSVAFATISVGMMGLVGAFGALFPLQAESVLGYSAADVGNLMAFAGAIAFLITFPNGLLVDRYGRKAAIIPGLLLLALTPMILAQGPLGLLMIAAMLVYGLGEGICQGVSQVFAMDLAPEGQRGAFMGIWALYSNLGSFIVPPVIGAVAQMVGFAGGFYVIAAVTALSALLIGIYGPEPQRRAVVAV